MEKKNNKQMKIRMLVVAMLSIFGAIACAIVIIEGSLMAVVAACLCVAIAAVSMQTYDILAEEDMEEEQAEGEAARIRATPNREMKGEAV